MQTGKENPKETKYYELIDQDLQNSIDGGVMPDDISISQVTLWTVLVSAVVIVLCVIAINLYTYFKFEQEFAQAVNTEYREINNLRGDALKSLQTKGVIDEEAGLYAIPVDSAMTLIIRDYQQD